jgi:hypothetical protein
MKITKTTFQKVESILKTNVGARDNYSKLLAAYWKNEVPAGKSLFTMLKQDRLTAPESINRARRAVQASNPSLKGKTYTHRKTVSTAETKESLGYK